jgi:hypothetical protein
LPASSNFGINDTPFVDTWHGKPGNALPPQHSSAGNGASGSIAGLPSKTYSARNASACSRCVAAHWRTPCWFGVIADHLPPRPTIPPTQRSSVIPSGIVVCRYHNGGGLDEIIALAQVEGIVPVLPILEGGHCVCHFVFGQHRLWWQHRVFLLGLRGQNLHPTSHPTPLPHVSNWPTGITSVGSHGTTIPPSLCYSLAFPSAYCAVVALLIVLSNLRTNSTSTGRKRSSMQTLFAMDWTTFTGNATTGTLGWMWNQNCFAVHWTLWHGHTTPDRVLDTSGRPVS